MDTHDRHVKRNEIDRIEDLRAALDSGADFTDIVIHALDLTELGDLSDADLDGALFLGCEFSGRAQRIELERRGAFIFPKLTGLPYDPYRSGLYTVDELFKGYETGGYVATCDFQIYAHFDRARRQGYGVAIKETLAQRLHDHAIDDALYSLLDEGDLGEKVIGVMGGHSTKRTDPYYRKVAHLCWELTREGYFIASGGGPGIMEAANLGAYLANWANPKVVDAALEILAKAPEFAKKKDEGTPAYIETIDKFIAAAREVAQTFGAAEVDPELERKFAREDAAPAHSLAIPTWFYGHEPSNLFSTHIAKYFSNSLREDGLLAISLAGVIFAPGSAGTWQEIFMDLAQNHYATFTWRSPMVFLGTQTYSAIHALIQDFISARRQDEVYGDLVAVFDAPRDITEFIKAHPPRAKELKTPLYELEQS